MKKIIVFDLDGTLLDHRDYKITPSSLEAIRQLKQQGHVIILATGRDLSCGTSRKYVDEIQPLGVVHSNGQKVTLTKNIIFERFFSNELLSRLFNFAEKQNYCIGCTIGGTSYFLKESQVRKRDIEIFGNCRRVFGNVQDLFEKKVYSLNYYGNTAVIPKLQQTFPELRFPVFSNLTGADCIHKEASKAAGMECILKELCSDWNQVIAFGDSENDVEMLKNASISVAMGNGTDMAKAAADIVTRSIEKDGIVYALKKLKLLSWIG